MDLTNFALLLVAVGIFAIVPIGCVMTRSHGGPRGTATTGH